MPDASLGVARNRLPVHGFVLAGGKSSRMGQDKALLHFGGRAMVEIAVEKLRGFCAAVSIAGNREDLSGFAPVVREGRLDVGPAAGIEAGLKACTQEWALFVPVDVPLVPGEVLLRWVVEAMAVTGLVVTSLMADGRPQPAFCLLRRDCLEAVTAAIEAGVRRMDDLVDAAGRFHPGMDAASFGPNGTATGDEVGRWFTNLNTPAELEEAAAWAKLQHPNGIS